MYSDDRYAHGCVLHLRLRFIPFSSQSYFYSCAGKRRFLDGFDALAASMLKPALADTSGCRSLDMNLGLGYGPSQPISFMDVTDGLWTRGGGWIP